MKEVIYFTRFMPTCDRGGGSRRMMQMWDVLKQLSDRCQVVSTQRNDWLAPGLSEEIHKSVPLDGDYPLWSDDRRKPVHRLREISRAWSRNITEIKQLKLAVMDDPIYFIPLFETLKQHNIPILALCHNLETLAPQQVRHDPHRSLFNKEIDLLGQCDLVVTISREETFLLHNLGIDTLFFPYYPVEPILNRLLWVRQKRQHTNQESKKGVLLLGNVLNLQTRQGMQKVIDTWQSAGLFRQQGRLMAAGFGTENHLRKNYPEESVKILGTLSNDQLDRLLCTIRACLCYQEAGAGALTRIGEMLVAGVPVLANSHAARSYYYHNGVLEFRDLEDLKRILTQNFRFDEVIPVPPAPGQSFLQEAVKKIWKIGKNE